MTLCSSNVTSGFIDLATFDEIERHLYGGEDAAAYFVRDTKRSTWFTQVPVCLSRAAGSPDFGQEWSVSVSRAGDYLLHTWLRVTLPQVTHAATAAAGNRLRWTRNLMHNLISECAITFNDLVAARFDNYHLDFWAAFTVPQSKRVGYNNMIGNITDLTDGVAPSASLPSVTLNLPIPFFYSRDSGVALPTAALPYNEMRINFRFRDYTELLVVHDTTVAAGVGHATKATSSDVSAVPKLDAAQVWANYAIVSNEERRRMACAPRDVVIEQVQTAPRQSFNPSSSQSYDLRFSHAIKALFFAVRNKTVESEWSNYTTSLSYHDGTVMTHTPIDGADPILQTSLIYENTNRLAQMGSDYFSLVNPYYHAPAIPTETGYHSYSYSLDFLSLDPKGSTNYGKLTNVSIVPEASDSAKNATNNVFEFVVTAVNNNIVRISGGALGFPVL